MKLCKNKFSVIVILIVIILALVGCNGSTESDDKLPKDQMMEHQLQRILLKT